MKKQTDKSLRKLAESIGTHVTVHLMDGSTTTGVLLYVSEGGEPPYLTLDVAAGEEVTRQEVVPWHEIKKIVPFTTVDEEIIRELEKLDVH